MALLHLPLLLLLLLLLALPCHTLAEDNRTAMMWPLRSEFQDGLPTCVSAYDIHTTAAPTVTSINAEVSVGAWWKLSNTAGELPFSLGREDNFGRAVARLGDVNGDGNGDIVGSTKNKLQLVYHHRHVCADCAALWPVQCPQLVLMTCHCS